MTLLAFGNGSPDVFASILAAKKMKIILSVGALVGSGLFITCIVVAAIILSGGTTHIHTAKFQRDAGTFLLAICLLMIYGAIGKIGMFEAFLFLFIYCIYVFLVLYFERLETIREGNIDSYELPVLEQNILTMPVIIEDYITEGPDVISTPYTSTRPPHSIKSSMQWSFIKFKFFLEKSYFLFQQDGVL